MKVAYVCPFDLGRCTGTPIRARRTIEAVREYCDTAVIDPYVHDSRRSSAGGPDRTSGPGQVAGFIASSVRQLRQFKPDIVHAFTAAAVPAAVAYRSFNPRTRIVFEMHGLTELEMTSRRRMSRLWGKSIDRLGLWSAAAVIVMSHSQKRLLEDRWPWLSCRTHVLWAPTAQVPVWQDLPESRPMKIGYLGNAAPWQGLGTVIGAARLLSADPSIVFLLGGVSADHLPLDAPPSVEARSVPAAEGGSFLAGCHVLLSTRVGGLVARMQFPQKLADYLAAGRPVVVSDVGDQAEIVRDHDLGAVFRPEDAESLAQAISTLASQDADQLREIGRRAHTFAATVLSPAAHRDRLLALYEATLRQKAWG